MKSYLIRVFGFIAFIANYSDISFAGDPPPINPEPTDKPPTLRTATSKSNGGGSIVILKPESRGQYNSEKVNTRDLSSGCWFKLMKCCSCSGTDYDQKVRSKVFFARFCLPVEHDEALNDPNRLKAMKFNNATSLEFDKRAKLPSYKVANITVYICIHNYPVLVDLSGLLEHTYYSPNSEGGLWMNEELSGLRITNCLGRGESSRNVELQDRNGVKHYVLDHPDGYEPWVKALYNKYKSLTKSICKTHKSNQPYMENPTLEVTLDWLKVEPLPKIQDKKPNVYKQEPPKDETNRSYALLYLNSGIPASTIVRFDHLS